MTCKSNAAPRSSDTPLELHKIISRMSRDDGNLDDMSTLGEAAARIILLEQAVRNLVSLMKDTQHAKLHVSLRMARAIVDGTWT